MSDTNGRPVPISGATLIWAIAVMFIAVLGAGVIIAIALPDSQNPAALVGQLFAAFAALMGIIVVLFKVSRSEANTARVEQKLDDQAEAVEQIREQTNGGLHRAVRQISYESMRKALVDHLDDDPGHPPGV